MKRCIESGKEWDVKYTTVAGGRVFNGLAGKYNGKVLELAPDTIDIQISDEDYLEENYEPGTEIETIILPRGLETDNPWFPSLFENLKNIVVPEGLFKKYAKMLYPFWHMIDDGQTQRPWKQLLLDSAIVIAVEYGVESVKSVPSQSAGKCLLVPETVRTLEKNAFEFSAFETVYICEGLQTVKNGAFKNCKSLTTVYLPKSLATIETGGFLASAPFSGCTNLKEIIVPKGSKAKFQRLLDPLKLSHLIVEQE